MIRPAASISILLLALWNPAAFAGGAPLNTAAIAASAVAAPACLNPRPIGTCVWILCLPIVGCSTSITPKVGHYNPDLVVSAYNGSRKNPWLEVSSLDAAEHLGGIVGGSPPSPQRSPGRSVNLMYKDAQAFGHPLAGKLLCPSAALPFVPYYLSSLDPLGWKASIPESLYPEALIPGLREIGAWPANTWGPVYPRSGWLMQTEDPKAAAVFVQRVGDIVTRAAQPHIYKRLEGAGMFYGNGKLAWALGGALKEGDAATGYWQMLAPSPSLTCETFGGNDTLSVAGWGGGKVASDGDYAWTLWRPYSCCGIGPGVFAGSIDVVPFP